MKVAYIAHPIGGNVHFNIRQVVKRVGEINRTEADVLPFAPYIVDCMALNDDNPTERNRGFKNNYHYFESGFIQELRLYGTHISPGMLEEIEWAGKFGIEVKNYIHTLDNEDSLFVEILNAVSKTLGITPSEILSKIRKRENVMARQFLIGIYYDMDKNAGPTDLGKKMGLDHSTVLYNKATCDDLLFSDSKFKALYQAAKSLL